PACRLCPAVEDEQHFFWSCPVKAQVWSTISVRFLVDHGSLTFDHIRSLNTSPLTVKPEFKLSFICIIATTILHIWNSHWHQVFQGSTFWPDGVAARITLALRRIHTIS
ncbi:hypothetical protein BDB00DRAFT_759432, partial [Zychaea mexicana]|uniref:uncharacterized protein n=1 Tax=Zychaea mexicana TaxID=64656 RepID=UPI0022FE2B5F